MPEQGPIQGPDSEEKEPGFLQILWGCFGTDLVKGCGSYTKQLDTGTGKVLDLCMFDRRSCKYYDGVHVTRGETEPVGKLSQWDCGIGEGVQVGHCRLQKDALRLGPIPLLDKKLFRPTPREK